jgi:MFS family permease
LRTLILRELPLFATFFFTTLGFGGMQIARPLFSASFGVSLFFVALVTATGAWGRVIAGPVAGWLTDRLGRKPMVILGLSLRVVSSVLSFYAASYEQFLAFEFLGSVGLSIWNTGVSVVVADVTSAENRGRAIALRTASQRLGILLGPLLAGVMGEMFGLRSIFLLNGGSKLVALLIFVFLIRETRPDAATRAATRARRAQEPSDPAESLRLFFTRPFMTVAFASFALFMMSGGSAFEVLFPLHASNVAGLGTADLGQLLTLGSLVGFFTAFPNGMIIDRFGRKASLVPGLALLAVAGVVLANSGDRAALTLGVMVMGMGEGMAMGVTQVLAMDLAPEGRRGTFMGVWQFINSVGSAVAPLLLGWVGQSLGIGLAFMLSSVVLGAAALVMWVLGPETRRKPAVPV